MLQIMLNARSPEDKITPINIASALIEYDRLRPIDLREIAEHLLAYTNRIKVIEEHGADIDI